MSEGYLNREFFAGDTVEVARALLGVTLIYGECAGRIVETEAYKDDAASHAVTRPKQGALLRETYGCIYIFLAYGMYHCLNFTTERHGTGAVLIRALEPLQGVEEMQRRRGGTDLRNLTNGPGKLFLALGLKPELHGEEVGKSVKLVRPAGLAEFEIVAGPRVGISNARDLPWRFFVKDNPFVSKAAGKPK